MIQQSNKPDNSIMKNIIILCSLLTFTAFSSLYFFNAAIFFSASSFLILSLSFFAICCFLKELFLFF